ncbi:MAG: sodium:solute symporter, partial [Candidatus Scalindua sp.]|nr:sodium:solute symporter [Candidatus Scalindua sp.]
MISLLDWLVILIYACVVIAFGFLAGKKESTTEDYFLGGRKMPWFAVMISIYATSLSALTFIGVPGAAFEGDFVYLQLAIGDLAGRVLVSTLLLTAYYKSQVTTIYEFLGKRFGPRSRDAGTGFFMLTR